MSNLFNILYSFFANCFVAVCAGLLWNYAAGQVGLPTLSIAVTLAFFWLANVLVTWFTRIVKSAWNVDKVPSVDSSEKKVYNTLDNQ